MTRVQYSKPNACDCGMRLLRDEIPLGTEYLIEESVRAVGTLICGACGKQTELEVVLVYSGGFHRTGFMPACVFEEI